MAFTLAIVLNLALLPLAHSAPSEINSLLQQKDWPGLVLLLKPKEGQNFDHDLVLSKAYLQLERRLEAQKLLLKWLDGKHDEIVRKQLDITSSLFFSQETSNLYFEAVRLISIRTWGEAKERLDQAALKEPGNLLIMSRLVQVQLQLAQKEAAAELLKKALELNPNQKELNVFSARLDLDDEEERNAQKKLLAQKAWIFEQELPTLWYFESLQALNRSSEVLSMQKGVLKVHPNWGELRLWLMKNGLIPKDQLKLVQSQMDDLLKDPERYNQNKESEYRKGQYYWISDKTVESMKTEYRAWIGETQKASVESTTDASTSLRMSE